MERTTNRLGLISISSRPQFTRGPLGPHVVMAGSPLRLQRVVAQVNSTTEARWLAASDVAFPISEDQILAIEMINHGHFSMHSCTHAKAFPSLRIRFQ